MASFEIKIASQIQFGADEKCDVRSLYTPMQTFLNFSRIAAANIWLQVNSVIFNYNLTTERVTDSYGFIKLVLSDMDGASERFFPIIANGQPNFFKQPKICTGNTLFVVSYRKKLSHKLNIQEGEQTFVEVFAR